MGLYEGENQTVLRQGVLGLSAREDDLLGYALYLTRPEEKNRSSFKGGVAFQRKRREGREKKKKLVVCQVFQGSAQRD